MCIYVTDWIYLICFPFIHIVACIIISFLFFFFTRFSGFSVSFKRIHNCLLKNYWNIFIMNVLKKSCQIIPTSDSSWCWHLLIIFSHSSCDFPGSWGSVWFFFLNNFGYYEILEPLFTILFFSSHSLCWGVAPEPDECMCYLLGPTSVRVECWQGLSADGWGRRMLPPSPHGLQVGV